MKKILVGLMILGLIGAVGLIGSSRLSGADNKSILAGSEESDVKDFIHNYFLTRNESVFDKNKVEILVSLYSNSNQKLIEHELKRINFYKN